MVQASDERTFPAPLAATSSFSYPVWEMSSSLGNIFWQPFSFFWQSFSFPVWEMSSGQLKGRALLVRSRRALPFAVRMLGARHLPPRFDELVAHMQHVLPLRYMDAERPEEAEEDAPAGSGGVLGIERDVARL